MTYLKRYGKRIGYTFLGIIASLIIVTVFYYFNVIGEGFFSFLELLIVLVNVFINSFILGKESNKKGYIEGFKFGGIIITLFLIVTLIFSKFNIRVLIYYIIILITTILGSMIGISKKRD